MKENNEQLSQILPSIQKEFDILNSSSFKEYEDKLTEATSKAIGSLKNIIEDGTLSTDPEQLVNAVKVLTKAKTDISDSRRKLLETLVRGEVMMKALETPKQDEKSDNILLEYLKQNNLNPALGESNASIFSEIEKNQ